MNAMISEFCRFDKSFALDIHVRGGEYLDAALGESSGVLIATVHTKLALAAHGGLRTNGSGPLFVGFRAGDLRPCSWGHPDLADVIEPDSSSLFAQIASALANGRVIVAFVDYPGAAGQRTMISPNLFAWARLRAIPVMPMLATLDNVGAIRLELGAFLDGRRADSALDFVKFVEARWPRRFTICRPKNAALPTDAVGKIYSSATRGSQKTPELIAGNLEQQL